MNLEDFVSESLKQIINGIKSAQSHAKEKGGTIVPPGTYFPIADGNQVLDQSGTPIEKIEFDIAVTVLEGKETKGGIGIFAGAIGLGSQGQSNSQNQSISRIKFTVPIIFPRDK